MMQDITGVECGQCHGEVFRLVPREVTHVIGVCQSCANQIDAKQVEKVAADGMTKPERRRFFQEQSFEWADKLHGKQVIVHWHHRDCFGSEGKEWSQVTGVAYRTSNECGGWGNVKVIIDPTEHCRIDLQWTYSIEYGTGKHCPYQKPIIDGQKYGLWLNLEGDNYYTLVSWGYRDSIALDVGKSILVTAKVEGDVGVLSKRQS